MVASNNESDFVAYVVDLMHALGAVSAKRMFGGYGIFLDGIMFGLIADSTLYLKADKELGKEFAAKGLEPFTYYKKGKPYKMSYFQAPEEALENGDEMRLWAKKAYEVALAAAEKKGKK